MDKIKLLKELYLKKSKHSNYQILQRRLAFVLSIDKRNFKSRYENERLVYILNHIEIKGKNILDVGGNTGYFSFELLDRGASHVHYYEGNKEHTEFVRLASEVLDVSNKITITNDYMSFDNSLKTRYDIILLLNVLHHIGDDYGNSSLSIEKAKQQIIAQLRSLHNTTKYIGFQLGFNWKGDINQGLFTNGTKKELINYIKKGVEGIYDVEAIGIAEKENDQIVYRELNDYNILRDNSMGEFLNRPLFILKSLF